MANLLKKSTLKILKTDVAALVQQHYPNLYVKLSSTTLTNASISDDGQYLVLCFAEADDGNQLV